MIHFKMLAAHSPDEEEQHPQIPLRMISQRPKAANVNAYQRKCMASHVLELFPGLGDVSLPTEKA